MAPRVACLDLFKIPDSHAQSAQRINCQVLHDFEHGGLTNDFLVSSNDPLAVIYNDK